MVTTACVTNLLYKLLFIFCALRGFAGIRVPKYCVNETTLERFQSRLSKCGITSLQDEIEDLYKTNAVEYQRGSHELRAMLWLVQPYNPFRVASCKDADLEYIPLLPLHWRVSSLGLGSRTDCTYGSLIESVIGHVRERGLVTSQTQSPSSTRSTKPYPFSVASTFNMRTEMGTGLKSQVRRGPEYDQVTSFVTSMFLGHYERWPQCPDLLRKGWLGIVEIPYVALGEPPGPHAGSQEAHKLGDANRLLESADENPYFADYMTRKRQTDVLFMGRLNQLYGPELVCSVRWSILDAARSKPDPGLRVINITQSDVSQGVQKRLVDEFSSSKFCIVAKGDSYSSSSLYSAIYAGCIPVVISDWFTYAFPWIIPYQKFVIRFSETNWLMDPLACIEFLKSLSGENIASRLAIMFRYKDLLQFQPRTMHREATIQLRKLWMREQKLSLTTRSTEAAAGATTITSDPTTTANIIATTGSTDWKYHTVLPLELMLVELAALARNLEVEQQAASQKETRNQPAAASFSNSNVIQKQKQFGLVVTHEHDKIFSCETPFHCASNATDFSGTVAPPVQLPALQNRRSYLCTHAHRLVGMYKMVYWQRCVRILWPLQPGKFKPNDAKLLPPRDKAFVEHFHNSTSNPRPTGWQLFPYPPL